MPDDEIVKLFNAKIVTETDKAYLVNVHLADRTDKDVWFPKAHCYPTEEDFTTSKDIYADSLVIKAKQDEIGEYILVNNEEVL